MRKETKKKAIAILTIATMIVTSVVIPNEEHAEAATKVKITNVSNGTLTIKKGSTYQLKAKAGSKSKLKFSWKSSNPKKVSVSKKGKIKGLKNGKATITVSVKGKKYKKAKVKVTVGTKVSKVKVLRPAMVLYAGSTATIVSQVLPQKASNKKVKYTSSNEKVARVSNKGVVKGIKAGTAKITIKATDGSGKKTTVTVKVAKDANEIKLVDDFYQSANSEILNSADIDLKTGRWSQIDTIDDKVQERIDEIIEDVSTKSNKEGTVEDNVADFYQTALDTKTRDQQNIKTIQGYLDEINQVSDLEEYITLQGKLSKDGVDGGFDTFVYNDLNNVNRYQVYFDEINTGISYLEFFDEDYENVKKEYTHYVEKLLKLSGETAQQASSNAAKVIDLQRNMAAISINTFNSYNINFIYNEYTLEQLKAIFTNCDISSYLQAAGYGDVNTFIVCNPKQLRKMNEYLVNSNLSLLKEYTKLQVLFQYAPYLTTKFYEAYETFDAVWNMKEEKESIEEVSKTIVKKALSWDISKLYVERYVSTDTKKNVEKMVDSILEEYRSQINNCTWMKSATKKEAIKKLDKLTKNISYPDDWSEYLTEADFKGPDEGGTFSDNVKMLYKELEESERKLLGTTADGSEWDSTPLLVNAYYMPYFNSITIPIGITDETLYSADKSDSANLGALGIVIGHEISHAFDADGSNYDENGKKRNWWTASDKKQYNAILKKLEKYYETFEVLPGVFQDGEKTLSENIADLAGANCVIKLVENNKEARNEFFMSYANLWAGKMTDRVTMINLIQDVHSNWKVRVNAIVSLMDEFYETYNVKKTDAMYVAPEDRIKIW